MVSVVKNTYTLTVASIDGSSVKVFRGIIGKAEAEARAAEYRKRQCITAVEKEARK